MKSFSHYTQLDAMDCGPTCLRMIAKYHGRSVSLDYLREKSQYGKAGVSLLGVAEAAESIGFRAVGAKLTMEQLMNDAPLPAIIHWNQGHFVALYRLSHRPLQRRLCENKKSSYDIMYKSEKRITFIAEKRN